MKMDNKNKEIMMKYLRILQTQIQDIGNTLHDFETELYKEKGENNYEEMPPCPICGNEHVELTCSIYKSDGEPIKYIKCNFCGGQSIPLKGICTNDAIKIWNKREEVK